MQKASRFQKISNLFFLPQIFLFSLLGGEEIRLEIARGSEIMQYAQEIVKISDAYYSQYPYIYDGTQCDEEFYQRLYASWPEAWLAVAFDEKQAVGYAIGAPMNVIPVGKEPLLENGYAIDELFLLGEIALLEPYRHRQIGTQMVKQMEQYAKNELNYSALCLMQINEAYVKAPRPDNYQSSDGFWLELGYEAYQNLSFDIKWKNVNEPYESNHVMFYRIKPL